MLGILSTVFPILGMSADDEDAPDKDRDKISPGLKSLVINCIVLEFLTSVWGLLLAGPVRLGSPVQLRGFQNRSLEPQRRRAGPLRAAPPRTGRPPAPR